MSYTASVTSPLKKSERISRSLGIYSGKCDITEHAAVASLVEITAITKFFKTGGVAGFTKGIIAVVAEGLSDNGYEFRWDYTTGAFSCYLPTNIVIEGSSTGAAITLNVDAIQAVSTAGTITAVAALAGAVDAGEIGFYAIGFI